MVSVCIHAYWFCVACIFNKYLVVEFRVGLFGIVSNKIVNIFGNFLRVSGLFVCLWIDHSAVKLCLFKFSGSNELVWCLRLLASTLSVYFNCSRWLCHIWYGMIGWHIQTHIQWLLFLFAMLAFSIIFKHEIMMWSGSNSRTGITKYTILHLLRTGEQNKKNIFQHCCHMILPKSTNYSLQLLAFSLLFISTRYLFSTWWWFDCMNTYFIEWTTYRTGDYFFMRYRHLSCLNWIDMKLEAKFSCHG